MATNPYRPLSSSPSDSSLYTSMPLYPNGSNNKRASITLALMIFVVASVTLITIIRLSNSANFDLEHKSLKISSQNNHADQLAQNEVSFHSAPICHSNYWCHFPLQRKTLINNGDDPRRTLPITKLVILPLVKPSRSPQSDKTLLPKPDSTNAQNDDLKEKIQKSNVKSESAVNVEQTVSSEHQEVPSPVSKPSKDPLTNDVDSLLGKFISVCL